MAAGDGDGDGEGCVSVWRVYGKWRGHVEDVIEVGGEGGGGGRVLGGVFDETPGLWEFRFGTLLWFGRQVGI